MNADTFKQLFLPYHQKLFRIAFRLMENPDNAEDMLQNAYLKLWEKRNELGEIDNYEAFAIVTLRNTCLDHLRKQKEDFLRFEPEISEADSLLEQLEQKDETSIIEQFLSNLPTNQKIVMKLKHWDCLSDQEIEDATGLSQVNIRVLLSRARTAIREHFNYMRE